MGARDMSVRTALAALCAAAAVLAPVRAVARAAPGGDSVPPATSPFLEEHAALLGRFARVMMQAVNSGATYADRSEFVLLLRGLVLPHARVEEQVLYPTVDSVLGTNGYATATLVLDHKAIARLVDDLDALAGSPNPEAFRRKAYALDAVLEAHFAKEEQFVLPILTARMDRATLTALFDRMGMGRHI